MNDGRWHRVSVLRARQSLDLVLDGERFGSQVAGSYFELNTEPVVFIGEGEKEKEEEEEEDIDSVPFSNFFFAILGGAAPPHSTLDFTRGHFSSGLVGCVRGVTVQNVSVAAHAAESSSSLMEVSGLNVGECTKDEEKQ